MSLQLSSHNSALAHLSKQHRRRFCQYAVGPDQPPTHSTIHHAIQSAISSYPNHIAARIVQPDASLHPTQFLTYAQLNARARLVSATLHARGVRPGHSVCLFITRGLDMLVAIVAILQLGASYVPQDVRIAPAHQLSRVATATNARVVLTQSQYESMLPKFERAVAIDVLDAEREGLTLPPFVAAHRPVTPEDVCYIIFTSGTTGAPKGVQVTHANVANVLLTAPMSLGMRPGVTVSQILSVAFDMGAWEVLGSLSHAATLIVRGRNISHAVRHAQVVIATPTVLASVDVANAPDVRTVAVAGEPCPRALAEKWGAFCHFYNACGPTEVTIVNTAKRFQKGEHVLTIGKPTPNNTVYVLDPETRKPCAIGEVGEMWGGGKCVSKGYLGNNKLTNERYLHDPFLGGNARMYRTGDLGRWNATGELEHFGRVDEQVKVKGFRVELDGVSAVAESTKGVWKAVVIKMEERLVAFVTPADVRKEEVRKVVGTKLPYYCIPSEVVCMDKLPKTSNGKVDKRELRRRYSKVEDIVKVESVVSSGVVPYSMAEVGRRLHQVAMASSRTGAMKTPAFCAPFVFSKPTIMKLHSDAADRNKAPILKVLQRVLPASGHLLEIAAGSGQHVAFFADALPAWHFSPTDPTDNAVASIDEYIREAGVKNVAPAALLDATTWPWPVTAVDAIYVCNMVHISPWAATEGLMRGASRVLNEGGVMVLYGPYLVDGETAESNLKFSKNLRERNAEWGVREVRDVEKVAKQSRLVLKQILPLPANNLCVVFEKKNLAQLGV